MVAQFTSPVLNVAAEALHDLEGREALAGLWALFTKCKDSLQDGSRLENISWRLWHRELMGLPARGAALPELAEKTPIPSIAAHGPDPEKLQPYPVSEPYRPVSPVSPLIDQDSISMLSSSSSSTTASIRPPARRSSSNSSSVGKIICDILPDKVVDFAPKRLRTVLPPHALAPSHPIASPQPLKPSVTSAASSLQPSALGPQVVVVNPTPHPTPPATPHLEDAPALPSSATEPSTGSAPSPPPRSPPANESALATATATPVRAQSPPPRAPSPPRPASAPKADDDLAGRQSRTFFLSNVASPDTEIDSPITDAPPPSMGITAEPEQIEEEEEEEEEDAEHGPEPGTSAASRETRLSTATGRIGKRLGATVGKNRKGKASAAHAHVSARPPIGGRKLTGKMPQRLTLTTMRKNSSDAGPPSAKSIVAPKIPAPPPLKRAPSSASSRGTTAGRRSSSTGPTIRPTHKAPAAPQKKKAIIAPGKSKDHSSEYESDRSCGDEIIEDGSDEGWEELTASDKAAEARRERELARLRAEEAEAQRQKAMFKKLPPRSYSNLARTQSAGLLSQLLNPDPTIFPPNHPYRMNASSGDLTQLPKQPQRRLPGGLRMTGMGPPPPQQQQRSQLSQARPAPPQAQPPVPPSPSRPQFAPPALTRNKSGVALPTTVTATCQVATSTAPSPVGSPAAPGANAGSGGVGAGYRSRARPSGVEMEDESGSESEAGPTHVARSLAHQKLAALADKRSSKGKGRAPAAAHADSHAPPLLQQLPTHPPPTTRSDGQLAYLGGRPALTPTTSLPAPVSIPVGHPYNLPAPAPPTTPRTTRRQMLATELSESLRRNLLWERQVVRPNAAALARRRAGVLGAGGALRPLTALEGQAGPTAPAPLAQGGGAAQGVQRSPEEQAQEVRRQQQVARQRSWAGDYHYSGW